MLVSRIKKIASLIEFYGVEARPNGVSATQQAILHAVAANPGLSLGALGQRLGMKQSGVSRMVDRMVSKRILLRRKRSQDKRVAALHLDIAGQAHLLSVLDADHTSDVALRGFGRDDRLALNRFLDRIAANLSASEESCESTDEAQKNALEKLRAFF